jgi:hypothetical protein
MMYLDLVEPIFPLFRADKSLVKGRMKSSNVFFYFLDMFLAFLLVADKKNFRFVFLDYVFFFHVFEGYYY